MKDKVITQLKRLREEGVIVEEATVSPAIFKALEAEMPGAEQRTRNQDILMKVDDFWVRHADPAQISLEPATVGTKETTSRAKKGS